MRSIRARTLLIVSWVTLISFLLVGLITTPAEGGVRQPNVATYPAATVTPQPTDSPTQNTDLVIPVGTEAQRRSRELWPGGWYDANPFGNVYVTGSGNRCRHTGVDLNLRPVAEQPDEGKPVHAIADGVVYYAGHLDVWGNVLIIRHWVDGETYRVRYGHLQDILVKSGQTVEVDQQIGTIGRDEYNGPPHLHLDISPNRTLMHNPEDWPCMADRLYTDYVDPVQFYREHWAK